MNKHRQNLNASKRFSNANGYNVRSYFRKLRDKVVSKIKIIITKIDIRFNIYICPGKIVITLETLNLGVFIAD